MLPPATSRDSARARPVRLRPLRISAVLTAMVAAALACAPLPAQAAARPAHPVAHAAVEEVPFYVVQPSFNGEPEFLFAIAQRFLGDGERFREIFALNEGRVQPDGLALTDPAVLNPGWILQLPPDARGEGLQLAPPVSDFTPALPVTASPRADGQEAGGSDAAVEPADEASTGSPLPVILGVGTGVVVLLAAAAGVLFVLRRRRASSPRVNTRPADRSSSWIVDSALRVLRAACEREGLRFPGLYTVTVDDDSLHVLLTETAPAPVGWTASDDGRTWSATLAFLQSQPVPPEPDRSLSRLVFLGVGASGALLVDFSRAHGAVSVDGIPDAVDDVVEGWIDQLTSSPWADPDQRVIRAGNRDEQPPRRWDTLLDDLAQEGSGVLVLETPPSRSQADALRARQDSPDFRWLVLVKGGLGSAAWRFTIRDGVLSSGFLPDVVPAGTRAPAASAS